MVKREHGRYFVIDRAGRRRGGPYWTRHAAELRQQQVDYFANLRERMRVWDE